jgi:double-stranded uracil-DNA glycosylase
MSAEPGRDMKSMKRDAGRGVPPQTLPDLLRDGLKIVFVGINPGLYSATHGHYFARRTNRFWPAFSRSTLSREARHGLGLAMLGPEHDTALLAYGFGFTDVVKRPTGNAGELAPGELAAGAPLLLEKLARHRPVVACFHGLTGYRPFARAVFPEDSAVPALGPQPHGIGETRIFVVPNPSPANAHFTPADQAGWYDRLAELLAEAADR